MLWVFSSAGLIGLSCGWLFKAPVIVGLSILAFGSVFVISMLSGSGFGSGFVAAFLTSAALQLGYLLGLGLHHLRRAMQARIAGIYGRLRVDVPLAHGRHGAFADGWFKGGKGA
jgi:hypothetical protein